ncbi:cupin domain-containing protein [Paraburkholderia phenazinium]|uniref:Cupin domain-containing protein n=1 Tax=Paraburkholderia phenazinium TaxID=60549 RepID=A0A1N6JFL1_9BURK|nr:cupin domain-containing protein [Paraburkholderia phenazinium]SIO43184.1 Cupin domain-containing protein [Paraburkholderia phenazinium]
MTLSVRRVVTGHDANGKAVVAIDELVKNIASLREGAQATVIWTTEGFPIDNNDDFDGAKRKVATSHSNGTVFRVIEYAPGVKPRNHRTDSIDYAVVISGEIDMDVDGVEVHLKAGDVLVQRGTIHDWINRGTEPCVIAFVLIDAEPYSVGAKSLNAIG